MQSLDELIAVNGDEDEPVPRDPMDDLVRRVRDAFAEADVYALGEGADDTSSSDLMHFTAQGHDGREKLLLPVFTRPENIQEAVLRNPQWQSLSLLQIGGRELLENVDRGVTIAINPWCQRGFEIPPSRPS